MMRIVVLLTQLACTPVETIFYQVQMMELLKFGILWEVTLCKLCMDMKARQLPLVSALRETKWSLEAAIVL